MGLSLFSLPCDIHLEPWLTDALIAAFCLFSCRTWTSLHEDAFHWRVASWKISRTQALVPWGRVTNGVLLYRYPDLNFRSIPLSRWLCSRSRIACLLSIPNLTSTLPFWSRLSNKLNTGSRGLFGHPAFCAYFRYRISPSFCFKIPIPGLHIRQIPGPEGYFGHPALRAYLKSRISTPFCFKIPKPAFKWAKSQFPTNRLGLSIKYWKSGRLSPGGIRSPRHQRNRGQEI